MAGDVPEAPERVGRYEILLPIAKGGMATVYLARAEGHGGFDRYVALKLTLPHLRNNPELAALLLDEAKLVAHIRHAHVVPVTDVGQDALGVFLVMDYVAGDTLSGLTRDAAAQDAPLPKSVALRILVDALEGLHAAHEHADEDGYPLHLVHRDFSPQNILVGTDGVGRLTDFGIAKAASRISTTAAGMIKGKMSYVSPEQARGTPLDRRCDLWAGGVIAWEIMCGRKLNPANDQSSLISTVKHEPPRIRTIVPDAPEAIERAIASVLKLDPNERLATAEVFARDLAAAARESGMLAERHEVAEHVKRLAGPVLAERRARLASARRLRMGSVPDGVGTVVGLPSPLEVAARRSAPAIQAAASIPTESELSIVVTEASEPPPPLAAAPIAPPPPARVRTDDANTTTSGIEAGAAPHVADDDDAPAIPGLAARKPKPVVIAAAVSGAILIAVVATTLTLASGRDSAASAGASASAVASASATANAPSTAVAPPSTAVSGADPSIKAAATGVKADGDEAVATSQFLALTTNAPVAEVRIGERVVDMVVLAPNVNVELEGDEATHPLVIRLRSSDGRIATVTLPRGELEANVTFPPGAQRPAAAVQAPPRSGPTTRPLKGPRHL
jgi:serine/threonine-protein kinase